MEERRVRKLTPTQLRKKQRLLARLSQFDPGTLEWLVKLAEYDTDQWADVFVHDVHEGVYDLYIGRIATESLERFLSEYKNSRPSQFEKLHRALEMVKHEAARLVFAHDVMASDGHGYLLITNKNAIEIITKYWRKKLPDVVQHRHTQRLIKLSEKETKKAAELVETSHPVDIKYGTKRPSTRVRKRTVGPPMVQSTKITPTKEQK
jgi:hypothetical protein